MEIGPLDKSRSQPCSAVRISGNEAYENSITGEKPLDYPAKAARARLTGRGGNGFAKTSVIKTELFGCGFTRKNAGLKDSTDWSKLTGFFLRSTFFRVNPWLILVRTSHTHAFWNQWLRFAVLFHRRFILEAVLMSGADKRSEQRVGVKRL